MKFDVFNHLNAPNAETYRIIMRTFVAAKSEFQLHLRPQEVRDKVEASYPGGVNDGVESALQQLCAWGNLEAHTDTADAHTVDEFLRPRFLYQLSHAGGAAEEAIRAYEVALGSEAQLRTTALSDVRALLTELAVLTAAPEPDQAKVYLTFKSLWTQFDELTSQAQSFLGALQRTIDLKGGGTSGIVAYKQKLIGYLERFIQELIVVGSDVAEQLRRMDDTAVRRLMAAVAHRELADRLDASNDDREEARRLWLRRWEGICSWFVGDEQSPPLAEHLRARARAAIPALLTAIDGINESRLTRTDRVADFRCLARWFAGIEHDDDAHRLWLAAFGLYSARHLAIDDATLEEHEKAAGVMRASWLDAPPMVISPRLRATGRQQRANTSTTVPDFTLAKAALAAEAREESRQATEARRRLASLGRVRLSQLKELDRAEFRLFLDLLGQMLSLKRGSDQPVDCTSTDGTLRVSLEPTHDGSRATIITSDGNLVGDDHIVRIEDAQTQTLHPEGKVRG